MACGTPETLDALKDSERRPPNLRDPLPDRVVNHVPHTFVSLDQELFAGPSGMTAEHLRPMLESAEDTELLASFADTFAEGEVPQKNVDAIRMGRMTALRKSDGGVRGIVVGDLFRRLVFRTLAKQFAQQVEDATAPFQYTLKTRAGCECVAHFFQEPHRNRPQHDRDFSGWSGRIRLGFPCCHALRIARHGGGGTVVAFRADVLFAAIALTSSMTKLAKPTQSSKERAASKVTH